MFLIYLFITKMMPSFVNEAIFLKFIQNGIDKTQLINIDTLLIPFSLLCTFVSGWAVKLLGEKKLLKGYHWTVVYFFVLAVINYCILLDLVG
jgi:predicted permease